MGTYATQDDVEDYIEGWTTEDPDALERLIERAESDLDAHVFVLAARRAGAPKMIPAEHDLEDQDALRDACCAQVEYRHEMGEEHFVRAQRDSVTRTGYSAEGRLPIIGPKVWRELRGSSLVRLTTRTGGRGEREPGWEPDP